MSVITRDILALIGFMPVDEAIAFQQWMCVPTAGETEQDFRNRWTQAETAIRPLPPIVDLDARPQPLGAPAQVAATALSQTEMFKIAFGTAPMVFTTVLLEKLLTAQKYVDADHVGVLAVPDEADEVAVLEFCMRNNPIDPPLLGPDGGITFSSHYSQNLIPLNPSFTTISDHEVQITAKVISRPNYVTVVSCGGRYIISNGYHRAVALIRAGHTRMPCILRAALTLDAAGLAAPGFFDATRLGAARPPMASDFDPAANLATPLKLRSRNHVLRVGFQVSQFEAPR